MDYALGAPDLGPLGRACDRALGGMKKVFYSILLYSIISYYTTLLYYNIIYYHAHYDIIEGRDRQPPVREGLHVRRRRRPRPRGGQRRADAARDLRDEGRHAM